MISATLNWTGQAGTNYYLVQYKKAVDVPWITPPAGNPTTLLTYSINNLDPDTLYSFRISSYCDGQVSGSITFQKKSPSTAEAEWIINTFACEQDNVFSLDSQITGLSSPAILMYDAPTGRMYGTDFDNINGCFYWYLPTATLPSQFNYIQPVLSGSVPPAQRFYYSTDVDRVNRRLYVTGKDTDGLQIYDIATNTVSVIPYGYNHNVPPNPVIGNGFNRALRSVGTDLFLFDKYSQTMLIVDKASLNVTSTINITTIIDYDKCLIGAPVIHRIGNEYWVAQQGANLSEAPNQQPHIYRYNLTFSNTPTIIDLSAISAFWVGGNNSYWRASYEGSGFLYLMDFGSSNLIKINTTTFAATVVKNFNNRTGKQASALGFVKDPISNELFITGSYSNFPSDSSSVIVSYKWDEINDVPLYIYPNLAFFNLAQVGSTNQLHGAFAGRVAWDGNPNWDTDGIINKFIR